MSPRTVLLVAFDQLQLLDLAGPLEVFDAADRIAGGDRYQTVVATPDGARVRTTSRLEIGADAALGDLTGSIDTLVVVGGRGTRPLVTDEAFLEQIRTLAGRARRITSVCSGALVLGAAGLLDGYRATTHWGSCDVLRGLSDQIEVLPDQIYVHDRDRWTSAGVTAGIDLALALVEADHGPELAHEVAAWLVVFARRPGGQAQFSAQLQAQAARTPAVALVQRWLPDHLDQDLTVDRLADRAGMSPRSFARTFRAETGTTPAAHVEELRLEAARRLLGDHGPDGGRHRPQRRLQARRDAPPRLRPPLGHHPRPLPPALRPHPRLTHDKEPNPCRSPSASIPSSPPSTPSGPTRC